MKIRETIHHGRYRNVREVEIEPTWAGFVGMLQSSPYPMGRGAEHNQYVAKAFAKLLCSGQCQHGWANFSVLDS